MNSTVQTTPSAPSVHVPPGTPRVNDVPFNFNDKRPLWSGDTDDTEKPYISQRNEYPLLLRPNRFHGDRRLHVYCVVFAALAAVATAYVLLRCSEHLRNSRKPNGSLRSLAAAGKEGEDNGEPCVLGVGGEPGIVAVEGEDPNEEEMLKRANSYTSDLADMIRDSRRELLHVHHPFSVKGFTILLRFFVVELSAVCSLLLPRERQSLVYAVDILKSETTLFRRAFPFSRLSRATVRHMDRMYSFLQALPGMDFAGSALSSAERLLKLAQLLTLQQTALSQMQAGIHMLAVCCQKEKDAFEKEVAADCLQGLHKTAEVRRNQVLRDSLLSTWLRDQQSKTPHFGLVAPAAIQAIAASPPKPYEDHLKELLSTPLGLRQQQERQPILAQASAPADTQIPRNPLAAEDHSGQLKTNPHSSNNLSFSFRVGSEVSPDVAAPEGQLSQRPDSSGRPTLSGKLRAVGNMGTSDTARAGGHSATPTSSSVSVSLKPWHLATTSKRFWSPQTSPLQVSGHVESHSMAFNTEDVERGGSSTAGWGVDSIPKSSTYQMPPSRQPLGSPVRSEGASEARTKWDTGHGAWSTNPPEQGMRPTVQGNAADQFPVRFPGVSSKWISENPTAGQAVLQLSPWRPGMRMHPPATTATEGTSSTQFRIFLQGSWAPEVRRPPFKGVAVGEPAGGTQKQDPAPAALVAETLSSPTFPDFMPEVHRPPFKGVAVGEPAGGTQKQDPVPAALVAETLFSPTFPDFIKGLPSFLARSGEAAGK